MDQDESIALFFILAYSLLRDKSGEVTRFLYEKLYFFLSLDSNLKKSAYSNNSYNLQTGYAVPGNVEVRQRSKRSCYPDVLCLLSHVVS